MVKNLPAVQETGVRSLSREDALEKEMATHSSILAWEIPRTEGPEVEREIIIPHVRLRSSLLSLSHLYSSAQ